MGLSVTKKRVTKGREFKKSFLLRNLLFRFLEHKSVVGYTCHIYENDHSQTDEKRQ